MRIKTAAITDIGVKRAENQDSIFLKKCCIGKKKLCLAAVCDGVGSLKHSKIASNYIVEKLDNWFMTLEKEKSRDFSFSILCTEIRTILNNANGFLLRKQREEELRMATTVTCLFIADYEACIFNVGDSRTYCINTRKRKIEQITEDDVVYDKENKTLLAQSVGGKTSMYIAQVLKNCDKKTTFILASDGFYRKTRNADLLCIAKAMKSRRMGEKRIREQVEKVIGRGEKDNISAVAVYIK